MTLSVLSCVCWRHVFNFILNENIQTGNVRILLAACSQQQGPDQERVDQHPVPFLVSPAGDRASRATGRRACSQSFLGVGKALGREGMSPLEGPLPWLWVLNPARRPSSPFILPFFSSR